MNIVETLKWLLDCTFFYVCSIHESAGHTYKRREVLNPITQSVENANFFGIWEKPGLSICVSLCIGFWQMRKTFWNTSTDSVTLGNSEALGKMQKESEKGFPQLIEKLGLLDAQGGHKIIHYITLMNFHPLGRLLYIVVYWECCVYYVIFQN